MYVYTPLFHQCKRDNLVPVYSILPYQIFTPLNFVFQRWLRKIFIPHALLTCHVTDIIDQRDSTEYRVHAFYEANLCLIPDTRDIIL